MKRGREKKEVCPKRTRNEVFDKGRTDRPKVPNTRGLALWGRPQAKRGLHVAKAKKQIGKKRKGTKKKLRGHLVN